MTKCANCQEEKEVISGIKDGKVFRTLCERCAGLFDGNNAFAHGSEKRWQGREFARDVIQPFDGLKPNQNFIREYPDVAQDYWNEANLRRYG